MSARENALLFETEIFIKQLDKYLKDWTKTRIGPYSWKYEHNDEKIVFRLADNDVPLAQLRVSISYNIPSNMFTSSDRTPMKFLTNKSAFTLELAFSTFKSPISKSILFHDIIIARAYKKMNIVNNFV